MGHRPNPYDHSATQLVGTSARPNLRRFPRLPHRRRLRPLHSPHRPHPTLFPFSSRYSTNLTRTTTPILRPNTRRITATASSSQPPLPVLGPPPPLILHFKVPTVFCDLQDGSRMLFDPRTKHPANHTSRPTQTTASRRLHTTPATTSSPWAPQVGQWRYTTPAPWGGAVSYVYEAENRGWSHLPGFMDAWKRKAEARLVVATADGLPWSAGRNVLSASLDGTLKLWDVTSATPLASLPAPGTQPILSAVLGPSSSSPSPSPPSADHPPDPREVPETQSATVFCGLQDGSLTLFDLRAKRPAHTSRPTAQGQGGLAALSYNPRHHLLATGSSGGVVAVYDTRTLGSGAVPVTAFTRGQAGVESLAWIHGPGEGEGVGVGEVRLVVATADGLPYIAGVVPEGPGVEGELVGGDCDPVRCVRVREAEGSGERWDVWSAGDDAVVRRWRVREAEGSGERWDVWSAGDDAVVRRWRV